MAIRNIREMGDEVLGKVCKEVTQMTPRTRELIEDMLETMYEANGVGLAAPQVGILKRIVVIDTTGEDPHILINPRIVEMSGEQAGQEGCLSVPGKSGVVTRPNYVKAVALDVNMQPIELEGTELLARAICHELDHLDGHLYVEKVEGDLMDVTYDEEDEAASFIEEHAGKKPVVIVFGSGPIRIGQGIEFDYASVHCVWALKNAGYEVVIVNNNPETVSTDFNTADRLYFEPLTPEDVADIIRIEKPVGTVVAFGGQTAIRLTKWLSDNHIPILGTPADSIDAAEDRGRFEALLKDLHIEQPKGTTVHTRAEALVAANTLGYPVLLRPSYVLGGQNMIIAFSDADVSEYMDIILSHMEGNLVLIDKYMMGTELEVDAICDGEDVLIPGIMQHIDRAGIHSGDSIAVYPAWSITEEQKEKLVDYSTKLAISLHTKGLINIQYVISNDQVYVIEVNPRSSRTVPYLSKVTGIPMIDIATDVMLGRKLKEMPYGTGLYPSAPYTAIKVPVFSFEKLSGLDTMLGPEMKSTGEVLGIAPTMSEALYKGLLGAGYNFTNKGGVLITVRDTDKQEIIGIAKEYADLGFHLYATEGTTKALRDAGLSVTLVHKIHESEQNTLSILESGKINYIISTSAKGRSPLRGSVKVRRRSVELGIPCLTSLDAAVALAETLKCGFHPENASLVDICKLQH